MLSTDNGKNSSEIEESNGDTTTTKNLVPLPISTSHRGLIVESTPKKRFLDGFSALPKRMKFLKLGSLDSPSTKFQRFAESRDNFSRSIRSSSGNSNASQGRFNRVFGRKIDWESLLKFSKEWIRNPMNLALFVWILCVAISGAILFLVMTGMLNHALPDKSQRDAWFEVNNQILNALFTLMCLYQHPKRFYHLTLLIRWKHEDILKLRKVYCKNGTYKPHEWAHMMVVVGLLHLNCFAQYVLCGLNIGFRRSERPAIGVGISISFAIGAPAIAGIYSIISPLGREYESEVDPESQTDDQNLSRAKPVQKIFSFSVKEDVAQQIAENSPKWSGGIFDFWDDISFAYLSLFCSFCVFGWNMERFGFGNMYVHIMTFLLFCLAPFWIFNLAAVNIDNEAVRTALGFTGIFLCFFGLLYGGFWRIQTRKRFNLPSYNFCFGKPAIADCVLWLFCCWCSLAQEVRTGNSYDIVEEKFCRKENQVELRARARLENSNLAELKIESDSIHSTSNVVVKEEGSMTPPSPPFIRREDN